MKSGKVAAAVSIACAVLVVSACSDDVVEPAADSVVVSETASELSVADQLAGTSERPEGFPDEIPVVPGSYMEYTSPVKDSVGLEVTGATEASFDDAVELLKDGGFDVRSAPTAPDETLRTATFANDTFEVGITGVSVADMHRLTYHVVFSQ
ncbi:MAG: hypothetical protein GX542_06440 [Rhodococcus sp.]|nr:hypothetical protein [Rhodococcus sp. (in: high G+C Gram-positive bacteria)]